jgi:hypothetical protein
MRKLLHRGVAAGAIGMLTFALISPAEAKTCSERLSVCQKFCIRSEAGSLSCMAACRGYLQSCLETGCWESRYVEKECGFTRR